MLNYSSFLKSGGLLSSRQLAPFTNTMKNTGKVTLLPGVFLFSALFRDRCINVPYNYLRGGIMA